LFKPNTIYIPFGADEKSMLIRLHRPLHRRQINFQHEQVMGLDPDRRRIELGDGTTLAYDFAVGGTAPACEPRTFRAWRSTRRPSGPPPR
jgi:sulfide:quinone oxidoreductase